MKRLNFLAVLLACAGLFVAAHSQTYNDVRIAHIFANWRDTVPTKFYERARINGFNYVLIQITMLGEKGNPNPAWSNGEYDTTHANAKLLNWLRKEFKKADTYGLKIIPELATNNKRGAMWDDTDNNNIAWQNRLPNNLHDEEIKKAIIRTPAFAPDTAFERTFKWGLTAVCKAFKNARNMDGLSYSQLDYIHFGADEPTYSLSVRGKNVVLANLCATDTLWLRGKNLHTGTVQTKITALLGISIRRKAEMIREVGILYGHNAIKGMYYADMLDPFSLGGYFQLVGFNSYANPTWNSFSSPISTYDGLADNADVRAVIDKSVPVVWNYTSHAYDDTLKTYDTYATFSHLKNKGFKFMYGSALTENGNPVEQSRIAHLTRQGGIAASPVFYGFLIGAASFHWCRNINSFNDAKDKYDQAPEFRTMEYLSSTLWYNIAALE